MSVTACIKCGCRERQKCWRKILVLQLTPIINSFFARLLYRRRSSAQNAREKERERGRFKKKEEWKRERESVREGGVGRSAKRKLIIVPWIWLSGEIQGLCDVESAGRHYRAGQVSCRRLGRPRGPVSVNSPLHQIKRINFLSSCDQQR